MQSSASASLVFVTTRARVAVVTGCLAALAFAATTPAARALQGGPAPAPVVPAVPVMRAVPAAPAAAPAAAAPVTQDGAPARKKSTTPELVLDADAKAEVERLVDRIAATVGPGLGSDASDPVRGVGTHDASLDALHRAIVSRLGDAGPLLRALDAIDADKSQDDPRRFGARRAAAWILRREGRTSEALTRLDAALALYTTEDALLARAFTLDALDRDQPATKAYEAFLAVARDAASIARVRVRLALIEASRAEKAAKTASNRATSSGGATATTPASGAVATVPLSAASGASTSTTTTVVVVGTATSVSSSTSAGASPSAPSGADAAPAGPPSALFAYASAPDVDRETKDRAAVVLALVGRPQEAIRLGGASGEGADLFRQHVRLAEWSLLANAPKDAQEHAWSARAAATLRRDRLYALTVLVEAHRADDSLPRLIDRFAHEPDLDAESRTTWIDLLRETSRVDEAMALFRRSAEGGFTPAMRRELLEMCREANRDDELVATYRQLIEEEPDRLEWREGLARHWLERGRRDDARAVWTSYVESGGDVSRWMSAAQAVRDLGLEDLARAFALRCLPDPIGRMEARLFLFDMEARAGRATEALAQLDAFDREAPPDAPQRIQLSEAFERIGDKRRAVQVLEGVRTVRGAENAEEDLEMRYAWLLSETGDDVRALASWRNLWGRVDSLSRRRQVEDRLMATASRLGVLADIAVELEQKLARGEAQDRDAALLVRLYGKVGDPMSAAEVLEEHMKHAGRDEVAVLEEKARIYLGGKDYYHFERVVRRLVDLDPEKRSDHLRQLAMSQLERGKPAEARDVLRKLAECENPTDAAEFEAGVLALAGLNEEAARTYRKGLAQHPERIDGFLLLGNALNGLRQTDRAIGMFQFLAETAERDDLFTVAIDGILNMRAKEPVLRWARRVTLERIAQRHDKMYLYQLFADLSEELNDTPGMLRALETSLAIAGEQRSSVLRQLMDASQGKADTSYVVINGVLQPRRVGGESAKRLSYGRRLIGLGDLVPPQVYLDLGESFLRAGEVANASKTFSMARDVPDYAAFRRQVASSFETEGYAAQALDVYERAMASESLDVALLVKTASLHEQLGRDDRARALYASAIEVLLAQHALTGSAAAAKAETEPMFAWAPKNTNDYDRWFPTVVNGFLATSGPDDRRALADAQANLLEHDLEELDRTPPAAGETRTLASCPRVLHRVDFLRQVLSIAGRHDEGERVDRLVLQRFPRDEAALTAAVESRTSRGLRRLATAFLDHAPSDPALVAAARRRLGQVASEDEAAAPRVTLPEIVGRLAPLLIEGDGKQLALLLRRMQTGEARKEDLPNVQLLVSAATYLRDETSVVTIANYALRVLATHAQDWEDTQRATSILDRVRRVVSPEAFDVIVDGFVAHVAQSDERLQRFQWVISTLQERLGRPLLTPEAVKKRLEESLPDGEYMLPEMVALVPDTARAELVQAVWDKVPATSRSRIALELLAQGRVAVPEELTTLYLKLFEAGLDAVTETRMLSWPVRSIVDASAVSDATKSRVLDRVVKKWPDDPALGLMRIATIQRAGDTPQAIEALRKLLPTLPKETNDYFVRQATSELAEAWGVAQLDALLAEIERCETESGASELLDEMASTVLDRVDDPARRRAALDRELARSPEKPAILRRALNEATRDGDVKRALDLLARLVRVDPKVPTWRRQLVQRWRGLRHPVRALDVQRGEDAPAAAKSKTESVARLPEASYANVKKAVDEGRLDDARALYRRTWRSFDSGGDGRFFVSYSWGGSSALWPEDADAKAKPTEEEWRGGLSDVERHLKAIAEARAKAAAKSAPASDAPGESPTARRTVYEAIADQPFGLAELERQVDALAPEAVASSGDLLRGYARALTRTLGEEEAVRRWTARLRDGTASLVDRALLLGRLEDQIATSGAPDPSALSDLAAAVHPLDAAQLRALARIHARTGRTDQAVRIYEWCATLATSRRWFYGDGASLSTQDLIQEVARELRGADVERALTSILLTSDPGTDEDERDAWEALVIGTWLDQIGPTETMRRCADVIARVRDPKQGLHRAAAGRAVEVLLRVGDVEGALRALEVALCKFEATEVKVDPAYVGNTSWLLRARGIDFDDLARILPAEPYPGVDEAAWTRALIARAQSWLAADRIESGTLQTLASVAFLRRHARGDVDGAREILAALESLPRRSRASDLLVADAHRLLGETARADELEDALLADWRLPVARVHEVVARWRASLGDATAYERAQPLVEWTLHPKLLDQLVDLAGALGRADEKAAWEAKRTEAEAATATLDAPRP